VPDAVLLVPFPHHQVGADTVLAVAEARVAESVAAVVELEDAESTVHDQTQRVDV
jgi:hypothetical protein